MQYYYLGVPRGNSPIQQLEDRKQREADDDERKVPVSEDHVLVMPPWIICIVG